MSEMSMWTALESAIQDSGDRTTVRRDTLRRVAHFARPHRGTIASYLVLATLLAGLGVLAPVLAGQAVDAIVSGGERARVVTLALIIAAAALAEAGIGLLERLQSSRLGEDLILDLRR